MNFEDYETLPTSNVVVHMTAGAFAGVMEHCIMYPLDSVKTRMQSLLPKTTREGVSETFLRMIRHEGIFRPVRGMPAMILGAGPAHAFYFSSYEYLKSYLLQHTNSSGFHPLTYEHRMAYLHMLGIVFKGPLIHGISLTFYFVAGLSGCISTIFHDAIMNPAEVVKQRMQMEHSPYTSVSECIRKVYSREGISAFYRSYTTQLTMNIPFQSIHFMVYELAQRLTNNERAYNPIAHVISGAAAGGIAAAITTPLDVCKTLLNTQQVGAASGLIEAIKTVYRLGGPRGYFRGIQARVLFQMPSTAICWSTYEFFKYFLSGGKFDGSGQVAAEESPPSNTSHSEKVNLKPRELPAMSGAGLYGSISFNTMHTADSNFANRRTDSCILDINHT